MGEVADVPAAHARLPGGSRRGLCPPKDFLKHRLGNRELAEKPSRALRAQCAGGRVAITAPRSQLATALQELSGPGKTRVISVRPRNADCSRHGRGRSRTLVPDEPWLTARRGRAFSKRGRKKRGGWSPESRAAWHGSPALRRGPGHRGWGVLGPAGQAEPRPPARKGRVAGWLLRPHHPRSPTDPPGGQRALTHGGPGGRRGHGARLWGDLWEREWPSVGGGLPSPHIPGCIGQPASHQGDFYPFLPRLRKDPQPGPWPS